MEPHGALENPMEKRPDRLLRPVPQLLEEVVAPVVVSAVEQLRRPVEAWVLAIRRPLQKALAAGEPVPSPEIGSPERQSRRGIPRSRRRERVVIRGSRGTEGSMEGDRRGRNSRGGGHVFR